MAEIVINKENMNDYRERDLKAMELYLFESEDSNIDTTPISINSVKKSTVNIKHRIVKNIKKIGLKLSNILVSIKTSLYNFKQEILEKI